MIGVLKLLVVLKCYVQLNYYYKKKKYYIIYKIQGICYFEVYIDRRFR